MLTDSREQFEIGQKVKLKSGSPDLTVVGLGDNVRVEWVSDSAVYRETFRATSLTKL
jgi:uncharacterized protein YodC (DUF2158 family)